MRFGRAAGRRTPSGLLRQDLVPGLLGLQPMQADCHRMSANLSPFSSLPAVAEILEVNVALDDHRGAEYHIGGLYHPAQQRGRPVRAEHLALNEVRPCPL